MNIKNRLKQIEEVINFENQNDLEILQTIKEAEADLFKRKINTIDKDKINILVKLLDKFSSSIIINDDIIFDYLTYMDVDINTKGLSQIDLRVNFENYYRGNFNIFIDKTISFLEEKYTKNVFELIKDYDTKKCNLRNLKEIYNIVILYMKMKSQNNNLTIQTFLK